MRCAGPCQSVIDFAVIQSLETKSLQQNEPIVSARNLESDNVPNHPELRVRSLREYLLRADSLRLKFLNITVLGK